MSLQSLVTSFWTLYQSYTKIGGRRFPKYQTFFHSLLVSPLLFLFLKIFHCQWQSLTTNNQFYIGKFETIRETVQRRRGGILEERVRRVGGKGANSWQEIPDDRKPAGRLAVSGSGARRRRRPLSVNGAESSLSGRGMDGGSVLA